MESVNLTYIGALGLLRQHLNNLIALTENTSLEVAISHSFYEFMKQVREEITGIFTLLDLIKSRFHVSNAGGQGLYHVLTKLWVQGVLKRELEQEHRRYYWNSLLKNHTSHISTQIAKNTGI